MSRHAHPDSGRNDKVHGDEPFIKAERDRIQETKDEYEADHFDQFAWMDDIETKDKD